MTTGMAIFLGTIAIFTTGFIGYQKGRKDQKADDEYWGQARKNLLRMVDKLPDADEEQLLNEIIKRKQQ